MHRKDLPAANPLAPTEEGPVQPLQACEDFYFEEGHLVFTASFLLKNGVCCHSGCRNCPYRETPVDPPPAG